MAMAKAAVWQGLAAAIPNLYTKDYYIMCIYVKYNTWLGWCMFFFLFEVAGGWWLVAGRPDQVMAMSLWQKPIEGS
jgi:hypothetical protein